MSTLRIARGCLPLTGKPSGAAAGGLIARHPVVRSVPVHEIAKTVTRGSSVCRTASIDAVKLQHSAKPASASTHPAIDVDSIAPDEWFDKAPVPPLNILLIENGHGSMGQTMACELQAAGHIISIFIPKGKDPEGVDFEASVEEVKPDLIICPFLTKRVPKKVYEKYNTIIVHPGPLGDGGPSSIDRAKKDREPMWGVTLLQAVENLDAGPVWAHRFVSVPINDADVTKSVLYRNYLIPHAVDAMWEVLGKFYYNLPPLMVDHNDHTQVHGTYRSKLTNEERAVDFLTMTAAEVAHAVAVSDSRPGATCTLHGVPGEYALYNAVVEAGPVRLDLDHAPEPGEVLGQRDGAVLVRCCDGSNIWIGQMLHIDAKIQGMLTCTNACSIKLPSTQVLAATAPGLGQLPLIEGPPDFKTQPLPFGERPKTWQQAYLWQDGPTMYVSFDYYNGAMSTTQCHELRQVLEAVDARPDIKAIVLLGSRAFFSNGVHLNVIEAAKNPAMESWHNINAIDDVVRATIYSKKMVVSALQANAGAGGAMMALAADLVWCQKGVVLNPHYKKMGLYGSEYWTVTLKERVGEEMADKLTNYCQPVSARQAQFLGMIDQAFECDKDAFVGQVRSQVSQLLASGEADKIIEAKRVRPLDFYAAAENGRAHELEQMAASFTSAEYTAMRKGFVFKKASHGRIDCESPVPVMNVKKPLV